MNPFKQRSSIPSSLLTSLIGWIGFFFIGPLMFGFRVPVSDAFLISVVSAIAQVLTLRLVFFILRMNKHILIGAFWGALLVLGMYYATRQIYPYMKENQLYWILIYLYIGAPVGGFLSYFYIDDKKIYHANGGKKPDTNYGRDAHWLEPFAFGVVAYFLAFFPFSNFDLFINVFIVGAISGVAAAGASHFSPDKWKRSLGLMVLIIIGLGAMQGAITGLLFRTFSAELYANYLLHGIGGGILTYLMTFLRGRQLAAKEAKGAL